MPRLRPVPSSARLPMALALLATLVTAPGSSQEPPGESAAPADELFEVVDVEIVNIDAWVTDENGDPVEGLESADFEVLRDGAPVPVTNFYAVVDGLPTEESESTTFREVPEDPLDLARPLSPIDEEHRLWLIVFIDNFNIDPVERKRVLPSLRIFLSQTLQPGDRGMVVTYDRGLEVRAPFTSDSQRLLAAVDEAAEESGFAVIRRREQQDVLKRIDKARNDRLALNYARGYAEALRNEVDRTVQALERLVESLGGLPGRKAMLHVSSGVPMLAGEEMFTIVGDKFGMSEAYAEIGRHDTTRAWERVDRAANAHRVVFYTLDAGGMRGMHFTQAEYEGLVTPDLRRTMDSVVPENMQASLRLMALETGGRAILNQNEPLPALDRVREDFRTFYSLGISSTGVDSARHHEIEVRLVEPRRGWSVRHRGAYRAKSLATRMKERLRAALSYSLESNPLGLEVEWGAPSRGDERETWIVPVQLRIPLRDLVLLPISGNRHELRLELYAGAAGGDDEISEVDRIPLGLRIADEHLEAARGESFVYTHRLQVSPGKKKVALGIFDALGQEWSVVSNSFELGG